MESKTVMVDDSEVLCQAQAYPWSLGIGVKIRLLIAGSHRVSAVVICPLDAPELDELSSLSEAQLISRALLAFVSDRLGTTPASALEFRRQIESHGREGAPAIYTGFTEYANAAERQARRGS